MSEVPRCRGERCFLYRCTALIGTRLPSDPTGLNRLQETAPPYDPTVGPCPGSYGGPRGEGAVSYERGAPAQGLQGYHARRLTAFGV